MALTINTNSLSNLVQNNFAASTARLNTAIERLTTGYKINYAKDNAAGYSIATQYSSKLSSYDVAQNNTAMGMDMLTTADEYLDLISSHLSRMRDLAEQSANGTYGQQSLDAIQAEFDARGAEINRILSNAEYNGIKLFNEPPVDMNDEIVTLTEEEALAQGYTIIKTADQLQSMRNNLSGKYILMDDIDLSGYNWDVVGTIANPFTGELNGNGHKITNLSLDRDTYDYVGLIGRMQGGKISNLGLENANVLGKMWVGGIVGYNYGGSVENSYVTGKVTGYSDVGAITGSNIHGSSIKGCYAQAAVKASDYRAGGLVGHNSDGSSIDNSFSIGDVSGVTSIGGLVGQNSDSSISKSYSTGTVSGTNNVAGFLGWLESGTVSGCYWDTEKSGQTTGIALGDASGAVGLSSKELKELIEKNLLPSSSLDQKDQNKEIIFQVGIHSDANSQIMIDTSFELIVSGMSVSNSDTARNVLSRIDSMIKTVNDKQTDIGALYNRMESAFEAIGVSIDNLTSSLSTLKDADIAETSSDYIKNQILQQASATLLSTANQAPAIALQLM